MASEERLRELEERYEGYTVYDNGGSKIGKVDDLFVDESDNEEYIGVKMGFLGTKSTLIPTEVVRVNEDDRSIEVSESKDHVKDAPSFSDDEDITAEYEERIRSHFGLGSLEGRSGSGSYGGYPEEAAGGATTASGTSESEHSDEEPSYDATGERESSGQDTRDDSSAVDAQYGERRYSDAATAGDTTEHRESGGPSGSGESGTYEDTGSSGTTDVSEGEDPSGSRPTTSRQTEETETFQEGGRTKVRRRTIREEIVDADDQEANS